ncbi:hypothetical protein Acr_00g0014370 [Actinidia rufa]|uniref:Uncharacterized protein n=1 Tax=Actinidia rufa TaxID=165716 RepID=A0A7J0DAW6_9ERIC|nr:hypothetical protein Acr_00g0014370 [Actinidia rufa]
MLGSSLTGRSREMRDGEMTQQVNAKSIRDEMVQAQNVAKDLKGRVAKLKLKKQHAAERLIRMKEDHAAALKRLEKEMAKLRDKEALAKTLAVEEYKSFDDFKEAVEKATSTEINAMATLIR